MKISNSFNSDETKQSITDFNTDSGLTLAELFMLGVELGSLFETNSTEQTLDDGEVYNQIMKIKKILNKN